MEKIHVIVEEFESPKNRFGIDVLIWKETSDKEIWNGKVLKSQIELISFENNNCVVLIKSIFEFIRTQGIIIDFSSID